MALFVFFVTLCEFREVLKLLSLSQKARIVFALAQKQGDHPAKFGTIGTFYWLKSRKYQL